MQLQTNKTEHNHTDTVKEICKRIKHLAFIADGNRRWAKRHNIYETTDRYKQFEQHVPSLASCIWDCGINIATFWLLSTKNIDQRSHDEIQAVIKSCHEVLISIEPILHLQQARLIHLGRNDRMPEFLYKKITSLEKQTNNYKQHTLALAIDYSGQEDMLQAIKTVVASNVPAENVTEETILHALQTNKLKHPSPDLIIRTGNAQRLSDFMSLQSGYSELYFPEKLFPDFLCDDLQNAFYHFGKQKRRFGKN